MDELIIVSVDSHAQMPSDRWADYLEPRYRECLPQLQEENVVYTSVMGALAGRRIETTEAQSVYDTDGAYRAGGFRGVWDAEIRLREMDREGIAGEFVYHGDHRATSLFHNVFNRSYPPDVCDAGIRAYHRWVHDTFGAAKDRLFLVGAGGQGVDVDALVAELEWISDHNFAGTYAPGFTTRPGVPPLFDAFWEPVWRTCEDRGLPLFIHAGFGSQQGLLFPVLDTIYQELNEPGAIVDEVITRVTREVFTQDFFSDVGPRRAMWHLMFGGVFDRHPDLQLVMTEVRADWLPATLRYLDEVYEQHRADLPAERSPTEYWHSNCLTTLSFVHRAEVEMRYELGIETTSFGRDYPHTESTWPNTKSWLRAAFDGVPDNELRLILAGNAIRYFGLDRARLSTIARQVGFPIGEISGGGGDVDPALIAHFDLRGGFLKPAEGDAKLAQISEMVREDLARQVIPA